MTRTQILILASLTVLVCIVLGIAVTMIRPLLTSSGDSGIAEQPEASDSPAPAPTATWTPIPTSTLTPTPTETPVPTPTYTRVLVDTATPTPSPTPASTPTPTQTTTPTPGGSGGGCGGGSGTPGPAPTPTSRYPLKLVEDPSEYVTKNYFFVVLVKITSGGDVPLPGYRMIGTHSPTGLRYESKPSCDYLCRASGPKEENHQIQEGNLAFETPTYEVGTWSLMLVDPQGQQASEVLEIETMDRSKRRWYYCHFSQ